MELGPPDEAVAVTLGLMALGLAIVLVADAIAHRLEHRSPRDEAEELRAR